MVQVPVASKVTVSPVTVQIVVVVDANCTGRLEFEKAESVTAEKSPRVWSGRVLNVIV
jgi:hypothetical protein